MAESKKTVRNTLFNPAVLGNTYEDLSQNAILLPAQEPAPTPASELQVTPANIIHDIIEPNISDSPSILLDPINVEQPEVTSIPSPYPSISNYFQPQTSQSRSNLSSALSSAFSSYLNFGNNPQPEIPAPELLDLNIPLNNTGVPSIPLYTSTDIPSFEVPKTTSSSAGVSNTFRRSNLKRPAYATIPGLTSGSEAQPSFAQSNLPPQPTFFSPPITATSDFQEIDFPENNQYPITSDTRVPLLPVIDSTVSFAELPVMSTAPASEVLSSPIKNNMSEIDGASTSSYANKNYRPVYHHWFFNKEKGFWVPFSMVDSLALDGAFTSNDVGADKLIATDGGRYDVNILNRKRTSVYWDSPDTEVRRCSWFYKNSGDGRYIPYEENIADKLEAEYKIAYESNKWHRTVALPNGESVVFHGPEIFALFPATQSSDTWTSSSGETKPSVVKRGLQDFVIEDGESGHTDHILFLIHGIGSVCDFRFRPVEEVVDEFRNIALQLLRSHYKTSCERGIANKIEVLPVSWHAKLHSTGVDEQLKKITLTSIPRLRDFANDTILDVLFYTSPLYCQNIISTVGNELNKLYDLFKKRNPSFTGKVSLGGHSLGSLILFDLLAHQHPNDDEEEENKEDLNENVAAANDTITDLNVSKTNNKPKIQRRISYMMGNVGAGQPRINYPHLNFNPSAFFALGSPIGMFVTVRGLDELGEHFSLPTCPSFFNIFHPYDPIAYRLEALVNPALAELKPVLIPHHKGRKRMHLELKETMARVGADLKQRVMDSVKSTWNSFYQLAMFHKQDQPALEAEVNETIKNQLEQTNQEYDQREQDPVQEVTDIPLGMLNQGRRIDYVLQESPFEIFNDYIFALTSHVCYWESEDTILMILKEIYSSMNIKADDQIPQQTMTIERYPTSSTDQNYVGMNPTLPMAPATNLPPPPTSGFIKKA